MPRSSFFSSGRPPSTRQSSRWLTMSSRGFTRRSSAPPRGNSWMARSAASRMVPSGSSDWLVWSDRCVHSMKRVEILRRTPSIPRKTLVGNRSAKSSSRSQELPPPSAHCCPTQTHGRWREWNPPDRDPRGRKRMGEIVRTGCARRVVFARDHHVVALEVRVREATA